MIEKDFARRAKVNVTFDGVDISKPLQRYFKSLTYTDNEEDPDDLEIQLADKDDVWLTEWLGNIEDAAMSVTNMKIDAEIVAENWRSGGGDKVLPCGQFELDTARGKGPPSTIIIMGTALPYSSQARQTKKSRSWEARKLSGIANDIAAANGMKVMYLSASDPYYARTEQVKTSDYKHLSRLCEKAGISLKTTNNTFVLFDQAEYEARPSIFTFKRGGGKYTKWEVYSGETNTKYASCRVSYTDPDTGKSVEGTAYVEDYNAKKENNQRHEVSAKVSSAAEAKALAEKHLRLVNKHQKTVVFTMPGNPDMMAGQPVDLAGWGMWTGKYIIKKAAHAVGDGGYVTRVDLRRVLEGY